MDDSGQQAADGLLQLCQELGLQYEPQDWGIINADSDRLSEFIEFYESHPNLIASQKFELGELILASANEALVSNCRLEQRLTSWITTNRSELEHHIQYWKSLTDVTEFPLAGWLRDLDV